MRVLMIHSYHAWPGGVDTSFEQEAELLESAGLEVIRFTRRNRTAIEQGILKGGRTFLRSPFNRKVYSETRELCRATKPTVAHVQNFWFSHSPSVLTACHDEGVPTVMSLRDFRLVCIGSFLQRDGVVCEDCLGRGPLRGVLHRCYRRSFLQSAVAAQMVVRNRRRGTWIRDVDLFLALTEHGKRVFSQGGLPPDQIEVKPNVVRDPGFRDGLGDGAVFVGRLSREKGCDTLFSAWQSLPSVPLSVVGDGPSGRALRARANRERLDQIAFAGQVGIDRVLDAIAAARLLVMPSEWYETFGRVIIEAFAVGRPVVASRIGAMQELIDEGRTGLLFRPGDAQDLARKVRWLHERPDIAQKMGSQARSEYERKYGPSESLRRQLAAYDKAIMNHRNRCTSAEARAQQEGGGATT